MYFVTCSVHVYWGEIKPIEIFSLIECISIL